MDKKQQLIEALERFKDENGNYRITDVNFTQNILLYECNFEKNIVIQNSTIKYDVNLNFNTWGGLQILDNKISK